MIRIEPTHYIKVYKGVLTGKVKYCDVMDIDLIDFYVNENTIAIFKIRFK